MMLLRYLDRLFNKIYTSKYNPIYMSGSISIGLFAIVAITGLYILFFYRLGEPYSSVQALQQGGGVSSWIRSLHRYASDLMVISVVFHILRMISQRKLWGPRILAWLTGVGLLILVFISGWTGFVLIWDAQAQTLATAGAKVLDSIGLFSDPMTRSFDGSETPPPSFFFMNLFLHVVLPLGMIFGIWVHTVRMARAVWLPGKKILWSMVGILLLASILKPAPLGPKADLLVQPTDYPMDWIFNFWMLLGDSSPGLTLILFIVGFTLLALVPWLIRPKKNLTAAFNDPNICQGCTQCVQDCPYEAVEMVTMEVKGKDKYVAQVLPELCVSCGLCSASCDPMTIGPEGRKAGDQVQAARSFLASFGDGAEVLDKTLVIGCESQPAVLANLKDYFSKDSNYALYPSECPGTIHAAVYQILAARFKRVIIASCPERNCHNKDGHMLLRERISGEREPTLINTHLRERIQVTPVGEGEESRFFKGLSGATSTQTGKTSWLNRSLAFAATFALVMAVAQFTFVPARVDTSSAILRISIRLVGQSEKTCKEMGDGSTALAHMQRAEVCTYRYLDYQLNLAINGQEMLDQVIRPGGLKGDRPIYANHEIALDPGNHDIEFSLVPVGTEDAAVVSMKLKESVQIEAGQVALIYYSPDEGILVKGASYEPTSE